jgi:hypothetical protein
MSRFRRIDMSDETRELHESLGVELFAKMAELAARHRARDLRLTVVYSTKQSADQVISLCSTSIDAGQIRDLLEGALSSVDDIGRALGDEKGRPS